MDRFEEQGKLEHQRKVEEDTIVVTIAFLQMILLRNGTADWLTPFAVYQFKIINGINKSNVKQ